ncbi:dienelactone hydrolase family protein [Chytriomyces sp. MP71]|nr:dienelactone hydrolase family protein [Chytriomyces sp. MP71]
MIISELTVDVPTSQGPMRLHVFLPTAALTTHKHVKFCGVAVFTEIYQVTGPVERFCRQIAGNGYIVACPETYHEFEPLGKVLAYDVEGTDRGNVLKVTKTLAAYDEDATLTLDFLASHPSCNGRLGATGMCLGGHLAFRCAFDPRVAASVCYFATDIHSSTLAAGKSDDSLVRCGEIRGECVMIFGKFDNHVPVEGRRRIYDVLVEKRVDFGWVELPAQHAFIRDELSKGRFDPPLSKICFEVLLEIFQRRLVLGLGPGEDNGGGHGPLVC